MFSKHLVNFHGKARKAGRTGRVIMTSEARVLRELRLQAGLSMRKAGELIRCSDSYISHIENGRTDAPTGERLDNFLSIYGGIKQKSFYEKVRCYQENITPLDELVAIIPKLANDEVNILLNLARSF